jgi:hypothetical protein
MVGSFESSLPLSQFNLNLLPLVSKIQMLISPHLHMVSDLCTGHCPIYSTGNKYLILNTLMHTAIQVGSFPYEEPWSHTHLLWNSSPAPYICDLKQTANFSDLPYLQVSGVYLKK